MFLCSNFSGLSNYEISFTGVWLECTSSTALPSNSSGSDRSHPFRPEWSCLLQLCFSHPCKEWDTLLARCGLCAMTALWTLCFFFKKSHSNKGKSEGCLRNPAMSQKGVLQHLAANSGQGGNHQHRYHLEAVDCLLPTPRPAESESSF